MLCSFYEKTSQWERRLKDRSAYVTRKLRLGEPEPDDMVSMTPGQRLSTVWTLTLQAWAFKGLQHEPRLRRDVVRVVRRGS